MINYKNNSEVELIRQSCMLVNDTIALIASLIKPGVSTLELNDIADQFIRDHGAIPSFKNYHGFPFACCMSVNDAIAIQDYTERKHGYGVVRELVGHGLGRELHEDPQVPNYGKRGSGTKLRDGLVIAIEPMINMGKKDVVNDT